MVIEKAIADETLTIHLNGRLDTTTAPDLEAELQESLPQVTHVVLDFTELEYLSSAGLRVLLGAKKALNEEGSLIIKNVNEVVMEVFEITGFVDILTITGHGTE